MDKADLREALIERAAIQQYDGGLTRWQAQDAAAKARGYRTWAEAMRATE